MSAALYLQGSWWRVINSLRCELIMCGMQEVWKNLWRLSIGQYSGVTSNFGGVQEQWYSAKIARESQTKVLKTTLVWTRSLWEWHPPPMQFMYTGVSTNVYGRILKHQLKELVCELTVLRDLFCSNKNVCMGTIVMRTRREPATFQTRLGFFTNSPQYKNANVANFVLGVPL